METALYNWKCNWVKLYDINVFDKEEEIWMDIPFFEGLYQFSNKYRFRNLEREINWIDNKTRTIPQKIKAINYNGQYPTLSFWKENKEYRIRIHYLLCSLFYDNPEQKPEVNHKNGIKTDFNILNLEWNTRSENRQHAYDTGLQFARDLTGTNNPRAKLNEEKVRHIRTAYKEGNVTKVSLAIKYNVDASVISDAINFISWKNVI